MDGRIFPHNLKRYFTKEMCFNFFALYKIIHESYINFELEINLKNVNLLN